MRAIPEKYKWVWWCCFRKKNSAKHKERPDPDCYLCSEETNKDVMWNNHLDLR